MRVKLTATLTVLILSAAVCVGSMFYVFDRLDEMDDLAAEVMLAADRDDRETARETLARMAETWARAGGMLEALTPHDDLHAVAMQYVEAATNLESGDIDDFNRSMALLKETLKHLREHEELSWSNIL